MLGPVKTVASRSVAPSRSPRSSRPAPEHPLLALQRHAGNRAVAGLVAQREPARAGARADRRRKPAFQDPMATLTDTWVQGIMEALDRIFDTSRRLDPQVAGYLQPYGGHLWNLYLAYRSDTAGLFPGSQRLATYDHAMSGLRPVIDRYLADDAGREWYDNRLRGRLERGRWDVQFGIASERVKGEVAAGRQDPEGTRRPATDAASDPSAAGQLVDSYLSGVTKVKEVYGGSFNYGAARTRRRAGESKASTATAAEIDTVARLEGTVSVLKTAKSMLALTDDAFAKKLATLDASGPLGKVRSKVELAKVAVDLVSDGTEAMHTVLSMRAAATGNQDALRMLNGFKKGTMGKIGALSSGIGILGNALTILDNPLSQEGLEAGIDIAATAGKGTPLAKAKDVYDFGKNAMTVLDSDAERSDRIDGAMGMIGVAGPLGASLKLTYDGLKALSDLYWGATLGLVAAGVHPATKRMVRDAQAISAGVEKLAATARLLEREVDPGQRAALQRIAEMELDWIGKDVRQMIGTARSRSDERDSYGNIRVYRELFAILRSHAGAVDPEAIMRGAIAVMRSTKWAAEHLELVIRAEATNTSLPDAMDWEVEQKQKAERAKKAAAERKRQIDEMLKGMPASQRELFAAMLS
jgi:hypothetical protein